MLIIKSGKRYCIPSQGRMMDHNEDAGIGMMILYKNITPTLYFLKGVVAGICVKETGRQREMKTNFHIDP